MDDKFRYQRIRVPIYDEYRMIYLDDIADPDAKPTIYEPRYVELDLSKLDSHSEIQRMLKMRGQYRDG